MRELQTNCSIGCPVDGYCSIKGCIRAWVVAKVYVSIDGAAALLFEPMPQQLFRNDAQYDPRPGDAEWVYADVGSAASILPRSTVDVALAFDVPHARVQELVHPLPLVLRGRLDSPGQNCLLEVHVEPWCRAECRENWRPSSLTVPVESSRGSSASGTNFDRRQRCDLVVHDTALRWGEPHPFCCLPA